MDDGVATMEQEVEAIPRLWCQCIHGVPCPPGFNDRVRGLEEHFFGGISSGTWKLRVSKIFEHMQRMDVGQGHGLTRKKKTCKKGSPDDVQQPEKSEPAVILVALHEMHDPLEGCVPEFKEGNIMSGFVITQYQARAWNCRDTYNYSDVQLVIDNGYNRQQMLAASDKADKNNDKRTKSHLDWAIEEGDKILSHAERMMLMAEKNEQCTQMEHDRLVNNLGRTRGHSSWIPVLDVWQLVCNQNAQEMEDEQPTEDFENSKGKVCTGKRKRQTETPQLPIRVINLVGPDSYANPCAPPDTITTFDTSRHTPPTSPQSDHGLRTVVSCE